jgi:hypothetical protein
MQPTLFEAASAVDARTGRTRRGDRPTSVQGAQGVAYRAGSQKDLLLRSYLNQSDGLTDEEAAKVAGLSLRACYWKRCGELREDGMIRILIRDGQEVTRVGDAGSSRIVCEITLRGRQECEMR